jgi:hypothetical protein
VPKNPGDFIEKLQMAIKAWTLLRPNKSFAGFTLESFKTMATPCFEVRKRLEKSVANTQALMIERDDVDGPVKNALARLVSGVKADGAEGEDGELYAGMGYMRRSARNSLQSVARRRAAATEEEPTK